MNSKKLTIIIIAAVAAIALIVGGIFFFTNQKTEENPITTEPTPTVTEPTNPEIPDEPIKLDQFEEGSELAMAAEMFPDAEATKNFTKEEVQLALFTANNYIGRAIGTRYFADGTFEQEGMPTQKIKDIFGTLFTPFYMNDFEQKISNKEALDSEGNNVAENLIRGFVYIPALKGDSPADWLPENCQPINFENNTDSVGDQRANSCFNSRPIFSEFEWSEAENGEALFIKSQVDIEPLFIVNGKEGFRPTHFNFDLNLKRSEAPDWENEIPTMAISATRNNLTWDNWQEK